MRLMLRAQYQNFRLIRTYLDEILAHPVVNMYETIIDQILYLYHLILQANSIVYHLHSNERRYLVWK